MSPYIIIFAVYLCLFMLIIGYRHYYITVDERKTFMVLALAWATSVFFGNYAFYKMGIMSFTPWINNLHHTFVWIAICLTSLYMLTRSRMSIWLISFYFVVFSFIVKVVEKQLFGIWEHDHFFWIFKHRQGRRV